MKWTVPGFIVVLVCTIPSYFFWSYSSRVFIIGNLAQIAGLVFAFLSYVHLASNSKDHLLRSGWGHLALGAFIWLMAQCLEIYCELVLNMIAYGTISDGIWIAGYFPLTLGLQKILRHRLSHEKSFSRKRFRSVLLLFGLAFSLFFWLFISPQLKEVDQPVEQALLDFLYPTLDSLLIIHCLLLWRVCRPNSDCFRFALLSAIAFTIVLVGDAILSEVKDFSSIAYLSVDIYYFIGYFLMAVAADQEARQSLKQASPKVA